MPGPDDAAFVPSSTPQTGPLAGGGTHASLRFATDARPFPGVPLPPNDGRPSVVNTQQPSILDRVLEANRRLDAAETPHAHPLREVLDDVLHQVTKGKGERHGGEAVPFWSQAWAIIAADHGHGFLTGQAQKKITEAVQSPIRSDTEPFERELLGAIAYLGMAILYVRKYGR